MTAAREKDSSDFDLETFVDLFDTAMTSDNPAVKKAFKNLLMISAIVNSEESDSLKKGPLRRLVDDIQNLNRRLNSLEGQRVYPSGGPVVPPVPMPSYPGPTWTSPGTPWPNNIPPGTIIAQGVSSTAFDDQFASDPNAKYTAMQVLEKLEAK